MTTPKTRSSAHNGTKWVDLNHDAKEHARNLNGGIQPPTPALYTSDYPNKDVWSATNLPEVLFYLELPENPQSDVKPELFVRDDNTILRKFEILPDYIAVDVEGWLVHAWRSLDSRIMLSDITERMVEDPDYFGHVLKKPPPNALSNHSYRGCRKILGSYNDYARRDQPHRATVESVEKLSYEKIWTNSVLSRSVEFPDRLVRLRFVRKGKDATGQYEAKPVEVTKENYLSTTFAIDHFCIRKFDPCEVSELENKLLPATSILYDLQRKAELHMLGHWKDLPKECMPESWFDRTRKGAPEKLTYDGGCEVCTWRPDQDATSPKARAFNFDYLRQRSAENSDTIDLDKAFVQNTRTLSAFSPKHGRTLKRDRASSIEQDIPRSVTPVASHTTISQPPSSAPAALRTKRIRLRTSKKSDEDTVTLEEDHTVSELPPAAPLGRDTRYKIKYLEKDEQYNGFWETDTEVEIASDAETVVDLDPNMQPTSKLQMQTQALPTSPPTTPRAFIPRAQIGSVKHQGNFTDLYKPLQATTYPPIDFLHHGYAGINAFDRGRIENAALIAGESQDDLFSSFTSAASFDPFTPQSSWDDLGLDILASDDSIPVQSRLRDSSMRNLLHQSAALHNAIGLPAPFRQPSDSVNQDVGDRYAISDSDNLTNGPSWGEISTSLQLSAPDTQVVAIDGPVTPHKSYARDFSGLVFTDEVNRFAGFGSHLNASGCQESPLRDSGQGSESSINMYQTSPIKAATRKANRCVFTINEGEDPDI